MRATAVIIKNNKILLIHRFSRGKEYYVLPGGGVEKGENLITATIREVKEETNLNAKIDKKLWEYENDSDNRTHHFFLITNFNGHLQLNEPESKINCKENQFILEWHDLNKLDNLLIYPETIKEKIIKEFSWESR